MDRDVEELSPSQREALNQLQAVMEGGDSDVAIEVLESVNWDVQRAANAIFENAVPTSKDRETMTTTPVSMERFEIDDSEQDGLLGHSSGGREFRRVPPTTSVTVRPLRAVIAFLSIPLRLLSSLLRFLFRILRIPFPQFAPFTWSSLSYRPLGSNLSQDRRSTDPRNVAERWVQSLEEETGAVCISRSRNRRQSTSNPVDSHGTASGADVVGSSNLTSRAGGNDSDVDVETKLLPDFFMGSYEEFVRHCETAAQIGCVVIVSEEHDDVPEFKRSTLTDPSLVKLIEDHGIVMWGGDIRDREAWSASQKLQATTYPFVAFIALQPRRTAGSGSSPAPTLTILSRHQGPSIPSASAPTAAQSLVAHLNEHLLPRVKPFLERIQAEARERARERALRAEQDRAFEESRIRDKERVERRMEEERRAEQERKRREEEAEIERQEAIRAEKKREAWEAHRMEWRRYGRSTLVVREPRPGETGRGKTIRIGLRMPDGQRAVRFFGEADSMTALYAYVDSLFIPAGLPQDTDPRSPPNGGLPDESGLAEEMERSEKSPEKWWGFKLVLAYPRKEIIWEPAKSLGDVEALKGGGQLVVEMVADSDVKGKQKQAVTSEDDDGYESEE
ncbi:hypothetical protein WOLCODRAFT_137652 [Wolfiporia cocos MD-104 SS10]|uniref:UBX domain-containing protein n=1 Tax=Wolfiporia cocos (strain MD-104) TaxID=742152 RepID=A0A2H3JII9_WOLCO|nr:hypothetical protein WOLCODRAFT_137652 [Wolfiporia cocos MD-104 SS10]